MFKVCILWAQEPSRAGCLMLTGNGAVDICTSYITGLEYENPPQSNCTVTTLDFQRVVPWSVGFECSNNRSRAGEFGLGACAVNRRSQRRLTVHSRVITGWPTQHVDEHATGGKSHHYASTEISPLGTRLLRALHRWVGRHSILHDLRSERCRI